MSALDAIRADIAELRGELAGIGARREQIKSERADLTRQLLALDDERAMLVKRADGISGIPAIIRRLERAEALLAEQEETEPVPERAEHVAVKAQEQDPIQYVAVKTKEQPAAPRPAAPVEGRTRKANHAPLAVHRRQQPAAVSRPKPNGMNDITDGGYDYIDLNNLSSTDVVRAALVRGWLEGGPMSQLELRDVVAEELDCIPGTAQSIVGRSLAILYKRGEAIDTGQKGEDARGHRTSTIWKLRG